MYNSQLFNLKYLQTISLDDGELGSFTSYNFLINNPASSNESSSSFKIFDAHRVQVFNWILLLNELNICNVSQIKTLKGVILQLLCAL